MNGSRGAGAEAGLASAQEGLPDCRCLKHSHASCVLQLPDKSSLEDFWMRVCVFVGAVLLAISLSGCAPASVPAGGSAATQAAEPALRISGSGAAVPLVKRLADAYTREHPKSRFGIDP